LEKLESVFSNLLWCGPVLALCTRSDHAGFEEDTFEHDIVLGKVEEHLSPNFLSHFEISVNPMFTIKQNLRFHNGDQPIVLQKKRTNLIA
jgi:hypothetical protein